MAAPDGPTAPPLQDNPLAPEVFANDAIGFTVSEGTVTITFASLKADHSVSPTRIGRVVSARVVLPAPAAQRLAVNLVNFLVKKGLDPAKALAGKAPAAKK